MFKNPPFLAALMVSVASSIGMAMPGINEIMANNRSTVADGQGDYDDWVEIFNPSAVDLDLSGYYFSDDLEDITKWQVPLDSGIVVPAGGYRMFWLDDDAEDGADHLGFRLAAEGDVLILTAPDGVTLIEEVMLPVQHPDISYGRDEAGEFRYLINPTPGLLNDPTGVAILEGVTFSREQGAFEAGDLGR
ncbi:lamin tail domain-containing protein [Akkermansiaceae bacterium]|nr:lamin tail domain-containing protein [Akkermansiaceae bacterium]MDB4506471.1 lamin tail domain-containing protein [bacterium]MDB4578904.1 lamin tail domain-containing protein [Akkermansiaceae bacterium]